MTASARSVIRRTVTPLLSLTGLIQRDRQGLRVGDLDHVSHLEPLEVLGLLRLDGLGTTLWALDRDGVVLSVDGSDRDRCRHLASDGAGGSLAGLGGDARP